MGSALKQQKKKEEAEKAESYVCEVFYSFQTVSHILFHLINNPGKWLVIPALKRVRVREVLQLS